MSTGTLAPELRHQDAAPRARIGALSDTHRTLAIVAGLTALAALLRFWRIGHQGYWFDEANTAFLVHLSPGRMLGQIPNQESTPPLYYCLAWLWARVFGYGEAGLRSLSALAGVLTVPVASAAGAKLLTRRAGVVVAALTACSPFLIWYSQEARSYALLALLTTCSLCALAYARAKPSARALAAWVLACALALATHYYAILAVVPQAALLLALYRRDRRALLAVGVVAAFGLALIPLAISQHGTGNTAWIAGVPLGSRLGQLPGHFVIGTGAPAATLLKVLGALAVVLALVLVARRADTDERSGAKIAGALVAGGIALILILVAVGIDDLISRNVIVLWVPALMICAAGLGARRAGALGPAGAALLCSVGIVAAVGVASERRLQRPDWRPVARAISAPGPGARAILIRDYGTRLPLSLYLPRLTYLSRRGARVTELDVIAVSAHTHSVCWWGADCNLAHTQLPSSPALPGFRVSGPVQRVNQFMVLRLTATEPTLVTSRTVAAGIGKRYRKDQLFLLPGA